MIARRRGSRCVTVGVLLAAAVLSAGCGARLLKLPSGPGTPAPDGTEAFEAATSACRAVNSYVAEASVSGRAGGQRLRARVILGLEAPDSARLEAYAFGQPVFTFVARAASATLLLVRERRVLQHDRPADVLEAITGAPLDGVALRRAITGCVAGDTAASARAFGDDWRVAANDHHEWYLQRQANGPWRLVVAIHRVPGVPAWRADYRAFDELPHDVRLTSLESDRFDLRLQLSDLELNGPIDAAAFALDVPSSATPISLDELRRSGPLAAENGDGER